MRLNGRYRGPYVLPQLVPRDDRVQIEGWKQAERDGTIGAECDKIVATRPVPDSLMTLLANLIEIDNGYRRAA